MRSSSLDSLIICLKYAANGTYLMLKYGDTSIIHCITNGCGYSQCNQTIVMTPLCSGVVITGHQSVRGHEHIWKSQK